MTTNLMKAAVLLGDHHLEIHEVPIPQPRPGEILVQVKAATTCGTDVKTYRRGHPKFPPPFIFGHEFGGDVVQLGEGVDAVQIGDRVTANVFAECGVCFYCTKGQGNLCEFLEYNFGAFAEYQTVPASIVKSNLFKIPTHVTYAQAAIVEPLVCVVHAHKKLGVREDESVAIIGAGGAISLLHLQMVKQAGAKTVFAVGHSDTRLAAARRLGADFIINAKQEDASKIINEETNGYGVDVAIECAGNLTAWQDAVRFVRRGGRVLWFGGLPKGTQVPLDAGRLHYGEITLHNVHGGTIEDAREAFSLIVSEEVNTLDLISRRMPLDSVEEALQLMISGDVIKVEIQPQG